MEKITLELPGGSSKYKDQSSTLLALQELAEETSGYEPQEIIALLPGGVWFEPSGWNTPFYPFLFLECRKTKNGERAKPDQGEYMEVVEIPLIEWFEMCLEKGQIRDSKSITTTALAQKHLKKLGMIL